MKTHIHIHTNLSGRKSNSSGEEREILENSPQSGRSPAQSGRVGVSVIPVHHYDNFFGEDFEVEKKNVVGKSGLAQQVASHFALPLSKHPGIVLVGIIFSWPLRKQTAYQANRGLVALNKSFTKD